mmetsp:Transcript_40716/g.97630  ORF Transcript_40716/g.97630 Transcript_40716/m.97630 type:complete len:254 (+) Transcript_40716:612-1373(+)
MVHGLLAHEAPAAIHLSPPSTEYSTEYCATLVLVCSMAQYSLPSKPIDGASAPGADQVTSSAIESELPESTALTVSATGALGVTLGVFITVSFAFCARLEKFMLRDDMYLNSPGLNLSMPRSTVAAAALSFWQLLASWSLFGLVAQPVCLESANCLARSACGRAPPKSCEVSGFHSHATSNMAAWPAAAPTAMGASMPELASCTMLCRSSLLVPSPLLLPLLLVSSLPVHCTCTMSFIPTTSSLGVKSYSVAG